MLGRIADSSTYNNSNEGFLQDKSYGIASDPLAQFACLFSALIHNVDHSGVPNTQLVKESATVVTTFGTQSVAEQNSVDVAWTLLLQPQFESLHGTICATKCEAERFRQLVVNDVLATDMLTPDLNALRENRWNQAFADTNVDVQGLEMSTDEIPKTMMKRNAGDFVAFNNNRKATVVMEHLWQASNVCHTMQHWQIYRKWNERLFLEVSKAFLAGRADCDPAETWYQNELAFFDSTVIPLAKKLEQCGVFVVSSDEYLNYAIQNRAEWHARGVEIVHEMVGHHSLK